MTAAATATTNDNETKLDGTPSTAHCTPPHSDNHAYHAQPCNPWLYIRNEFPSPDNVENTPSSTTNLQDLVNDDRDGRLERKLPVVHVLS